MESITVNHPESIIIVKLYRGLHLIPQFLKFTQLQQITYIYVIQNGGVGSKVELLSLSLHEIVAFVLVSIRAVFSQKQIRPDFL